MNKQKTKKLAFAAVAMVMAGSMMFSLAACTPTNSGDNGNNGNNGNNGGSTNQGNTYPDLVIPEAKATTSASEIYNKLREKDSLGEYIAAKNSAWQRLWDMYENGSSASTSGKQEKYTVAESYPSTTELRFDIGDKPTRSVSYANAGIISGTATLPDGKSYTATSLKPAWAALQESLDLQVVDAYSKDSNKVTEALTNASDPLSARDIITDGVTQINNNSEHFLDLSNYFEYMPNYAEFLEENPVVRLSLTSSTTTGAMYAAPYFDGYNDIEKYELFKTNWVEALLDNTTGGDTSTTFKSHAQTKELSATTYASIQSFMGTTGKWNTSVLDKDGNVVSAGIDVNYDKALEAAKAESSPLGAAIKEAAGRAYTTEGAVSGNIVDIMNFAINYSAGEVTGAELLKILQEYIKVAYYVGGTDTPFYTQSGYNLSDVFVGYCAAWDVDLYAALGRVLVTNPSLIKSGSSGSTIGGANATSLANLYLVAARQSNMQRMIDTTSLVGELYGVRGLESKNLYSYIDANGNLQDPRGDLESYEAFNNFSKFYAEGLVFAGGNAKDAETSFYTENGIEALSYHDYVNTQTPTGYQLDGTISGQYALEDGYYFTPVLTPVSKWNTQSKYDAETLEPVYDTYMRFTESWRTVKDTGFAVPVDAVKNNPEKLAAVLAFIDYLFSDDGQIEMTYGPMASDAESTGGFWYNREATATEVKAGTYFTYKGKNYYSETEYSGKYQPTVTDKVQDLYVGQTVNGLNVSTNSTGGWQSGAACARSYTNFARHVIGSALPIGNKLQSFEFQMTSAMGRDGALKVDRALSAGVIKHTEVAFDVNSWYICVPTLLPYTDAEKLTNTQAINVSDFAETRYFTNNKKATTNLYWEIIKYGFDASQYSEMFNQLGLSKA